MSLRVRIRWLLVVSAAICVALATVALYWVNLSLVDTLAERNAERELGKVEADGAYDLGVDRQRSLDAGCNAFLGKPVRVKALLAVCAQLLDASGAAVSG